MQRLLWAMSDHARLCLIAGLLAGLMLPGLAAAMQPWLPQMVAGLLCITALRLGYGAIKGVLADLRKSLLSILALQLLIPLGVLSVAILIGIADSPWVLAAVLATAAPAISGSPNLALIMNQDAGSMMRLMVLGTAFFPVTVLPLLSLMPQLGGMAAILTATAKLLVVILLSTGAGFACRQLMLPAATPGQVKALDGLSVLAFSAIVIGLMAALTPALNDAPILVLKWAIFAFCLSYGLQIILYRVTPETGAQRGPLAIAAGNRNIALFLVALPEPVVAPVMIFIGCWQLPMYLTPVLLRWLYSPETARE